MRSRTLKEQKNRWPRPPSEIVPSENYECLVCLCHFMRVNFLANRAAFVLGRLDEFVGELIGHAFFSAFLA